MGDINKYLLRRSKDWPRIKVLKAGSKEAERARLKVEAMDRLHYSREPVPNRRENAKHRQARIDAIAKTGILPVGPRKIVVEFKVCVKCKGTYGLFETKKAVARLCIFVDAGGANSGNGFGKGKSSGKGKPHVRSQSQVNRLPRPSGRLKLTSLLKKQILQRLTEGEPAPMYNCVVTIRKERSVLGGTRRFDYNSTQKRRRFFYVMKYNPDTTMCWLVPIVKCGVFSPAKKHAGHPMWRLVPEGKGKELHLPARECDIVSGAIAVHDDPDADKERWWIPDGDI